MPSETEEGCRRKAMTSGQGKIMKDQIIDSCKWHVEREAPEYKERSLNHFKDRWTTLLDWMRQEGLLTNPRFGLDVENWMAFEVYQSNFTNEGYELIKSCIGTWNPSFGNGLNQRHLTQWKKKLLKLRGS